ncbi:MAG: hypothetical protein HAW67_02610 [Endozoicomonadaceae bacterium]|nr:hypothetical protein [Endozoicomonadaceae bacterium]
MVIGYKAAHNEVLQLFLKFKVKVIIALTILVGTNLFINHKVRSAESVDAVMASADITYSLASFLISLITYTLILTLACRGRFGSWDIIKCSVNSCVQVLVVMLTFMAIYTYCLELLVSSNDTNEATLIALLVFIAILAPFGCCMYFNLMVYGLAFKRNKDTDGWFKYTSTKVNRLFGSLKKKTPYLLVFHIFFIVLVSNYVELYLSTNHYLSVLLNSLSSIAFAYVILHFWVTTESSYTEQSCIE